MGSCNQFGVTDEDLAKFDFVQYGQESGSFSAVLERRPLKIVDHLSHTGRSIINK